MNFLYVNFPSWIHPEIFPGLPVLGLLRWYGLMYIFAFGTAFFILKKDYQQIHKNCYSEHCIFNCFHNLTLS